MERLRSPVCTRLRSTPSPMMPSFLVVEGPTNSGVNTKYESSVNSAAKAPPWAGRCGSLNTLGKRHFEMVAVRPDGFDLDCPARRRRFHDNRSSR